MEGKQNQPGQGDSEQVQHAEEDFVLRGVVAVRFGEGDAVLRMVRQAHAEAVGLEALVGVAVVAGVAVVDARDEPGHDGVRVSTGVRCAGRG